ncbi:MAG: hypothetical protein ACTSSG_13120 [Candidatus Heimdallarchaeaceae archaeon]
MVVSDKKSGTRFFETSIPLVRKCLNEKMSISLLLSTLQMMAKGYIKEKDELEKFMSKRAELNPSKTSEVEKIKDMIINYYF